ncbi:methylisocitrate lyase [Corynebacterium pseudodiphtheriticum]|uniref:methylisocitrate lyase n=1 Tax=Corynebacterium pseudodiphtheriticum TaxID=37637 RepID=UPI001EF67538|nr:methylisocitrate lyase [Corynebacterium pseudodiphtheriticum]
MTGLFSSQTTANQKRKNFRESLNAPQITTLSGAFNPLTAKLIEDIGGFPGVYVSGAVLANDLGLPDIGLTTLTEVAQRSGQIARATELPVLVDADTGFGEPMSAARTISALEDAGLAGCHLEDQVNPKRCGHLDGKEVVSTELMVRRISAAVGQRRDEDFVICARTDAAGVNGIDDAIDRAKAYAEAGADLIFTEALRTTEDFEKFRSVVDTPLLANMTEFGKTELQNAKTLESIGYNAVIWPVSSFRVAMGATERFLRDLGDNGDQKSWLDDMQHRSRLYELVRYEDYNAFDQDVFTYSPEQNL